MLWGACLASSAAAAQTRGTVYEDRNANGRRDAGEAGLARVAVSNQSDVVATASTGEFTLTTFGTGVVSISLPDGFAPTTPWWRPAPGGDRGAPFEFGLRQSPTPREFTFVHASDTHIAASSVERTRRFKRLVDSLAPAFVIVTGDLVRDALRVGESEATGYYELFNREIAPFTRPVWTVPGNHEAFGIERDRSGVAASHPLYGRTMYRRYRGPDYYSFNAGGIHFVGLNSADIDDQRYYGHIDSLQLAWLARDLAFVPANVPVVTFNHIPFATAVDMMNGFSEAPPAPSLITVAGHTAYRHVVSNFNDVLQVLKARPYPVALQGHMHVREALRYDGIPTRFFTSAAIVGDTPGRAFTFPSGVTLFRVKDGVIDDGVFIALR